MSDYLHLKSEAASIYEHFLKVNYEVMSKAVRKAVRDGLVAIQKDVRNSLKSRLKGTNKHGFRWAGGQKIVFSDTLLQGVRLGKITSDDEDETVSGTVLITSTRQKSSGSYRLHILENGSFKTGERFTQFYTDKNGVQRKLKKPRSTGTLKAYNFFKSGTSNGEKFSNAVMAHLIKKIKEAQ